MKVLPRHPALITRCWKIPKLHYKKLERLSKNGIVDVSQVPDDLNLNEIQERAKQAMLSGETIVAPGLDAALRSMEWPCHYLEIPNSNDVSPPVER